ncbi:MAG: hypothetical protein HY646_21435 [Acidobacteria bacterium]|nr:hypothetical protein [Acidobacteriota bacterium]
MEIERPAEQPAERLLEYAAEALQEETSDQPRPKPAPAQIASYPARTISDPVIPLRQEMQQLQQTLVENPQRQPAPHAHASRVLSVSDPVIPLRQEMQQLQQALVEDPQRQPEPRTHISRVLSVREASMETRLPERGKPAYVPQFSESNESNGSALSLAFSQMTAQPTVENVEQVRAAHVVEIPVMPHLQVVRTVAMEVGEAGSQVVIRIEERGGEVNLKIDAASEPLRNDLESSIDLLVDGFQHEEIPVSRIEVGEKSLITKIRSLKEAK